MDLFEQEVREYLAIFIYTVFHFFLVSKECSLTMKFLHFFRPNLLTTSLNVVSKGLSLVQALKFLTICVNIEWQIYLLPSKLLLFTVFLSKFGLQVLKQRLIQGSIFHVLLLEKYQTFFVTDSEFSDVDSFFIVIIERFWVEYF